MQSYSYNALFYAHFQHATTHYIDHTTAHDVHVLVTNGILSHKQALHALIFITYLIVKMLRLLTVA
jgi:hypothetical protein